MTNTREHFGVMWWGTAGLVIAALAVGLSVTLTQYYKEIDNSNAALRDRFEQQADAVRSFAWRFCARTIFRGLRGVCTVSVRRLPLQWRTTFNGPRKYHGYSVSCSG